MMKISKIKVFEIIAATLTGLGKFVFMDWLNWKLAYIIVACLGWFIYVVYNYRKNNEILEYWGLSSTNFKQTFMELFPVGLLFVAAFILIGNQLGTNILSWHILPILLLYPIWGVIQQFLVVGLLAKNLDQLENVKIPRIGIILFTAAMFSFIHYPWQLLMLATFLLAVVYTIMYLNNRNLIVLGIFHGWMGAFFFYTIMEKDPWLDIFGVLGF
ncbi:MAG: CPBP family glutamic-type intramembrane protease [Saprospiraceae bacterium]